MVLIVLSHARFTFCRKLISNLGLQTWTLHLPLPFLYWAFEEEAQHKPEAGWTEDISVLSCLKISLKFCCFLSKLLFCCFSFQKRLWSLFANDISLQLSKMVQSCFIKLKQMIEFFKFVFLHHPEGAFLPASHLQQVPLLKYTWEIKNNLLF